MTNIKHKKKILVTLLGGCVYVLAQPGMNVSASSGKPPPKEAWDSFGTCYNVSYASCQESSLGNWLAPPCNSLMDWNANFYAPSCAQGASYGFTSSSSPTSHTCSTYIAYVNPCTGNQAYRSLKWTGPGGVTSIKTAGCRGGSCDNPQPLP
jgi:hypothetical protein